MKLLFVEDEPILVDEMITYFSGLGYVCEQANTFSQAEEKINAYNYDSVVLDITLPEDTGMKLIPSIRAHNADTGILILSAKNSLPDKLEGLNLGADDYITKPFYLEELSARINALYRRKTLKGSDHITFDGFLIELLSKNLFYLGNEINLTKKEYELLVFFSVNQNKVLSKPAIAEHLWGDNIDQADTFDTVYVHLMNLRKKLNLHSKKEYIKSVYGLGYKFCV